MMEIDNINVGVGRKTISVGLAKQEAAMGQVPEVKVSKVNEEVSQAGNMKTPKQLEKERKKEEQYWNKMITRREAFEMTDMAVKSVEDKLRLMFIQIETLVSYLISTGKVTREELDNLSKPVIDKMYGKKPTECKGDKVSPGGHQEACKKHHTKHSK